MLTAADARARLEVLNKKQRDETKDLANNLALKIQRAKKFEQVKAAVKEFIEAMEHKVYILCDGDLIDLAAAAAHRHGKSVLVGRILFKSAMERLDKKIASNDTKNAIRVQRA